ncbi:adenosine deaminase [Actinomycetospora soli]|uniref:adenosine deaminase n=1 Tax=Actinomycetospora soli TaxID=2893887 RepID=UPI001E40B445|nr:adenosine deaminase [Actinomycetospora soli]MCD2189715.1 adenosine deaminase [Actinomycetospora soli]
MTDTPPAVELHVHVEGTLEPELIMKLAERNRVSLPYADLDDLRARYAFDDLQHFLDLYYANMAVLREPADFAAMTTAYLTRAAAAGVRHVELFVDPQAHLARGVPVEAVLEGVAGALAAAPDGMTTGLIPCFLRDRPAAEAGTVLDALLGSGTPVLGIGLDSAELGHPPSLFADVYARARAEGLRLVAHAGEEGPAAYVWEALDVLGVERVDHGIRSLDDPALVTRLVEQAVPLTVCPLSNVRLRCVDTLAAHPLPAMLEAGLAASIHSDDPAYFGGYVDDNHRAVAEALGLDRAQVRTLAENAVEAAFVDDARRAELRAEVAAWAHC